MSDLPGRAGLIEPAFAGRKMHRIGIVAVAPDFRIAEAAARFYHLVHLTWEAFTAVATVSITIHGSGISATAIRQLFKTYPDDDENE